MEDGVYIANDQFDIQYVNPALERDFGPAKGVKKCYQYFRDGHEVCDNCRDAEVFAGKTVHCERINPKNKKVYDVLNTTIKNPDGTISKVEIFRDITKRKQMEEKLTQYWKHLELMVKDRTAELEQTNIQLAESERKYRHLFESSKDGIGSCDMEGGFGDFNLTFLNMLGYTLEEIQKLTYQQITPGKWHKADELAVNQVKAQGHPNEYEKEFIKKDGTVFPISLRVWLITDDDGTPKGMWAIARDITERKQIEQELENYREKITVAQRQAYINSMGALVAHQLNQPLTMINMLLGEATEQIENTEDKSCCSPKTLQNIEESMAEAKKAAEIINKFRQHPQIPIWDTEKSNDVAVVTKQIVSTLSERAKQKKLHISLKGMNAPLQTEINEEALEQIFFVIIQNTIDAADGKKLHKLTITANSSDDKIKLIFADNCSGIAPENIGKIFEPFFTTKSHEKGIGLGLEIVQRILIASGGKIHVESKLKKGTTFFVTLPTNSDMETGQ